MGWGQKFWVCISGSEWGRQGSGPGSEKEGFGGGLGFREEAWDMDL